MTYYAISHYAIVSSADAELAKFFQATSSR
jgi:hypothetical protein